MTCFLPAPYYYRFVMHNLHFVSTPIYIFTLVSLFREQSKVFQTYKYFIIAHIATNFLSEAYVTFLWLPMTHLPYDVYKTTGWLADLGVSGIFQFMVLAQFIVFIGLSIQEMFVHRFKVVVIHQSNRFSLKIPGFSLNVFRFLTLIHLLSITWISIDSQTLIYQQEKKDELFRTIPDLAKDIGCYTVFILAPRDPFLIGNVAIWGVLLVFGTIATFSSVYFINQFLKTARNISNETKKLQRMLIVSLVGQATIHAVLIIFPVFMQIYQMIFIFYDNNFATMSSRRGTSGGPRASVPDKRTTANSERKDKRCKREEGDKYNPFIDANPPKGSERDELVSATIKSGEYIKNTGKRGIRWMKTWLTTLRGNRATA